MRVMLSFPAAQISTRLRLIYSTLVVFCLLAGLHSNLVAQELLPFQKNGQWGYQTAQGTELIKPQYQFAQRFKNQYAVVGQQNQVGVINKKNQLIVPFKYDFVDYLGNDRFTFGFRDTYFGEYKVGVIDTQNKVVIRPIYRSIHWRFNHYVVRTERDSLIESGESKGSRAVLSKYGLYDSTGKVTIPCQYDYLSWLDDSLLVLQLKDYQALYNVTGRAITDFDYLVIDKFHEGLAQVVKGRLHGFINRAGEVVIKPKFILSEPFEHGLAMVMVDTKWGAIDKRGKFIIENNYSFEQVKAMLKERNKN